MDVGLNNQAALIGELVPWLVPLKMRRIWMMYKWREFYKTTISSASDLIEQIRHLQKDSKTRFAKIDYMNDFFNTYTTIKHAHSSLSPVGQLTLALNLRLDLLLSSNDAPINSMMTEGEPILFAFSIPKSSRESDTESAFHKS